MEYIHELHHVFEEELRLLSLGHFDRDLYLKELRKLNNPFTSYYKINLEYLEEVRIYSIGECHEIPFLNSLPTNRKVNDNSLISKEELESLLFTRIGNFHGHKIKEFHICKEEQMETVIIDLSIEQNPDEVSDVDLCYLYCHHKMKIICSAMISNLYQLNFGKQSPDCGFVYGQVRKHHQTIRGYLKQLEAIMPLSCTDFVLQQTSVCKNAVDCYKCLYRHLEEIIRLIENNFEVYLDKKQLLTYNGMKNFRDSYSTSIEGITGLIRSQGMPETIEAAICNPLLNIVRNKDFFFTYEDRNYLSVFIPVLLRLLRKQTSPDHDEIYRLLIALDYNKHTIYRALEKQLFTEMEKCENSSRKQVLLLIRRAQIKRVAVTSPIKYKRKFPGLKEHLLKVIDHHIDLLRSKEQLIMDSTTLDGPFENTFEKRKVNISVKEMALLARLFCETGTVQLENGKRNYFTFLSNIYEDKDGSPFSEGTIKNSFYSPDTSAVNAVQDLLVRMMGKLQDIDDSIGI